MSSLGRLAQGSRRATFEPLRRFRGWLDAMPHPELVCEISDERVAAARWGQRKLESFAQAPLAPGVVVPSPVEPNLPKPEALVGPLRSVLDQVRGRRHELALLVPDAVVRVFILLFEEFPRRTSEALPLLRWRLKKSIPFEADETVVSWMRQWRRGKDGLEIVAAVARQTILREYEAAVEAAGMAPGVVLSSTLAVLPLVGDQEAVLLARAAGTWLVSAILASTRLAVYRCTELGTHAAHLEPQALLDEIYPAVAYYQDSAHASLDEVRVAGLGQRFEQFRAVLQRELNCRVTRLEAGPFESLPDDAPILFERQLDALVGWRLNRGA